MRKFKLFAVFVLLALVLSAQFGVRGVVAAAESEVERAREVGQTFVNDTADEWQPGWSGSILAQPRILDDLDSRTTAYRFAVRRGDEVLGAIVVGGTLYDFHVLEAVASPPPENPSSSEVAEAVRRDIGRQVDPTNIRGTGQTLYLGYQRFYEGYKVAEEVYGFDLVRRMVRPVSELRSSMVSPAQYGEQVGRSTALAGWAGGSPTVLGVPLHGQRDPALPDDKENNNNCAPTSGAMLVDYHRGRGYSNFDAWTENHNQLYVKMKTNVCDPICPGTEPWNAASGWVEYAGARGYSFDSYWAGTFGYDAWSSVKDYIDAGWPMMVMTSYCMTATDWHMNALKGYGTYIYDDGSTREWLIVNDPWPEETGAEAYIDWAANWPCLALIWIWPT